MKEFRTELKVTPSKLSIELGTRVMTQGSCFSDAIGHRLVQHKLSTLVNPFGVIYNPESIHQILTRSVFNEPVPEHTSFPNNGLFVNFDVHSEFSARTKEELHTRLSNAIGSAHYFIKDAQWLMVTYGTAWVYERKETGEVVANCHKLPVSMFSKRLISVHTMVTSFNAFYSALKNFNPHIKVILTVSPVRHIKDTLELNSVSKSVLRVGCDEICRQHTDVEYFPAFEMMMDDLRDYRFYKQDMLHPTAQAEDYIWEKFMERYFSDDLKDFVRKWGAILSALRHKPFHPETPAHQQFLRETLKRIEELKMLVDVREEMASVTRQIVNK